MRQVIADLCDLLSEQKTVLEKLRVLSQEERNVIIGSQTERLESVVRLELQELSKLNAIEKKRKALHNTISGEFGLSRENINVSSIAALAEPDEQRAIKKLQTELTDVISRLTALNTENRELLKAQMEYSEVMLDLMVGSEDPLNNFYGGDGKATPEKKKATGFFDSRA